MPSSSKPNAPENLDHAPFEDYRDTRRGENGLSVFRQLIHLLNRILETVLAVEFFNFETD